MGKFLDQLKSFWKKFKYVIYVIGGVVVAALLYNFGKKEEIAKNFKKAVKEIKDQNKKIILQANATVSDAQKTSQEVKDSQAQVAKNAQERDNIASSIFDIEDHR